MRRRLKLNLAIAFNVYLFLIGWAVFAWCVAMSITFQSTGWSLVVPTTAIGLGIFLGLFMVVNSVLGCCSVRTKSRMLVISNLVLATLQFALLVLVTYWLFKNVNAANDQLSVASSHMTNALDKAMNNALLSAYSTCCSGCNAEDIRLFTNNSTMTCNNLGDFDGKFCDQTVQSKEFSPETTVLCESPAPCQPLNRKIDNCWVYPQDSTTDQAFPPKRISGAFCEELKKIGLVGFPQQGKCGAGQIRNFVAQCTQHFVSEMYSAGVAFALFATFMLIILVVGFLFVPWGAPAPPPPTSLQRGIGEAEDDDFAGFETV